MHSRCRFSKVKNLLNNVTGCNIIIQAIAQATHEETEYVA